MEYLEHGIIFLIFLLAVRYLVQALLPSKDAGCAKGCGKKCAVANLEQAMEQLEKDWQGQ